MAAPKEQIMDVRSVVEAVAAVGDDLEIDTPLYVVESLCMRCGENGTTRLLLTLIPHFRKVLLSAFDCPHCGERNNEVAFAGEIQPRGCCYRLRVPSGDVAQMVERSLSMQEVRGSIPRISTYYYKHSIVPTLAHLLSGGLQFIFLLHSFPTEAGSPVVKGVLSEQGSQVRFWMMLDRTVVKSESATIKIPELDFEIPPEAQRGSLSSIEGILVRAADGLEALQDERKKVDPQVAEAIDQFLIKLRACASGDSFFTFILDDPAGNSFIENPLAPSPDPSLTITFYERTPEQQAVLGYLADPSQLGGQSDEASNEGINSVPHRLLKEPHGSVGARAGRLAIAQGNSAEMTEVLFRYSAPEEVMIFPSTCGACMGKCDCKMFVTSILFYIYTIDDLISAFLLHTALAAK
ncbi:putative cathepsin B-like [Capsicum annuum]|nr:putative cathepsin B-like [Capsicum annuum]